LENLFPLNTESFIEKYLLVVGEIAFSGESFILSHPIYMRSFFVVTISATGGNDFTGFLLRDKNSVGTFSVSSGDTQTACSVQHLLVLLAGRKFQYSLRFQYYGFL